MELAGRSIIVTGGARGIGLATAQVLLARGARVTIGATSEKSLSAARVALGDPPELATVASDVSTLPGCRAVAEAAADAFGEIDALFTNAGVYAESPVENVTEELWDRVIDTNLKSTFFCIQAALPSLRARRGAIVTMSSYNGVDGVSGNASIYGAAKAAIINLTRALALDLAPDVRINAIAPGFIQTEKLREHPEAETIVEALAQMTPLRRIGRGAEVAHAVVFALENEFLTGATITLDGGRSAGR